MLRLPSSSDWLRVTLLAAISGPLTACGGQAESMAPPDGSGGMTSSGGATPSGGATSGGASSSGGATSTGGASSSGGALGTTPSCTNPVPEGSSYNGFVQCAEGYVYRETAHACPSPLPRAETLPPLSDEWDQCTQDEDCVTFPNGYCYIKNDPEFPEPFNSCGYGCIDDADCPDDFLCHCGDLIGTCVRAACKTDAECAGDLRCASYTMDAGCPFLEFACQTELDECTHDAECGDGACTVVNGSRKCQAAQCQPGRPFLIEGTARTAPRALRSDWQAAGQTPNVDGLSTWARRHVATYWESAGLAEHASIAAFARFSLQLLSLGAPAELIEATHQALADETLHARLCFALASQYRGENVGPGLLAMDGALAEASFEDIVETTLLEGCIGETVAALEASEAGFRATDPAACAVLTQIAADEARHAALAWRFVAWALDQAPHLRDRVESVLRRELTMGCPELARTGSPSKASSLEMELESHGVLTDTQRLRVRREALEQVVGPCGRALLGHSAPHAPSNARLAAR